MSDGGNEHGSGEAHEDPDARFFAALLSHFDYCDGIRWGRIQYLGLVQVAALGGGYAVRRDPLIAAGLFSLTLFLTTVLFLMMRRDEANRDTNRDLTLALGVALSRRFSNRAGTASTAAPSPEFNFSLSPAWPAPFRVAHLNIAVFLVFIVVNLAGLVYFAIRSVCD